MTSQTFNDDLLLNEHDQHLVYESFPAVALALDFPDLRQLFLGYDQSANSAKARRRLAGKIAILLGVFALLGASAEPLYRGLDAGLLSLIGFILAGFGIVSVLIGSLGAFSERSKQQWLSDRLMTERLRQFQFQMLVRRAPSILAAMMKPELAEDFRTKRLSWLSSFRLQYEGHLSGKLEEVLNDELEEEFWLHPDEGLPNIDSPKLEEFFDSYRTLRIEHQVQYANYKLQKGGFSSVHKQITVLTQMSTVSIMLVFTLHIMIALSLISFIKNWIDFADQPWVHVLILWTAICALTARAFEEGLQPTREQERYRRYRSVLLRMREKFDQASPLDRFRVMGEIERTIYSEMAAFLKTNDEARFVL